MKNKIILAITLATALFVSLDCITFQEETTQDSITEAHEIIDKLSLYKRVIKKYKEKAKTLRSGHAIRHIKDKIDLAEKDIVELRKQLEEILKTL